MGDRLINETIRIWTIRIKIIICSIKISIWMIRIRIKISIWTIRISIWRIRIRICATSNRLMGDRCSNAAGRILSTYINMKRFTAVESKGRKI